MDDKNKQLEAYKNELSRVKDANFQLLKKLNKIEHEKIEESSEANQKIVDLQAQIVKLRSENEKNAVNNQNLELQLARLRKECRETERSSLVKDQQLQALSKSNEEKVKELLKLLDEKSQEYSFSKDAFSQKEEELLAKVDELNHLVKCKREEVSLLENELERIRSHFSDHNQQLEFVKESAGVLEADKFDLEDKLNDKDREILALREEREKWKEEKDSISYKVHRLEECLEAERTGHLESKYNAELVQLRLNQSEKSGVELQSKLDEMNQIVETLTHRLRDTEIALDEEAKYARQYRQDMDRLKSDHENHKTIVELKMQVQRNTELTNALQQNSQTVSDLQRQLKQANKKSDIVASEKDALLQEIQVLLESYYNLETGFKNDKKGRHLMDQLKSLIQDQRKRLQETSDEIDKLTRNVEQINRKFQSNKDQSNHREKELKEAQNSLANSNEEMDRLRKRTVELERKLSDLRAANSEFKRAIDKEKQSTSILHEEIVRVKKIRKSEIQDRDQLARLLYGRLNRVGYSIDAAIDHKPVQDKPVKEMISKTKTRSDKLSADDSKVVQAENGSKPVNWPQMKAALIEGLTLLVEGLIKRQKEVQKLKSLITEKNKSIEDLEQEKAYQQKQLDDLNTSYNKQKQELTQRFVKAVENTSLRTNKKEPKRSSSRRNHSTVEEAVSDETPLPSSRSVIEMAAHPVHNMSSASLETSPPLTYDPQMQHAMSNLLENREKLLLATVALLTSMYFPLKEKAEQLAQERAVLSKLLYKYYSYSYCSRLRSTARVLHFQIQEGKIPISKTKDNLTKLGGIFRFRIVAIHIIAANRIKKLTNKRTKSLPNQPLIITPRTPRLGAPLSHLSLNAGSQNASLWLQRASKWMTSNTLIDIVHNSFNELLPYLSTSSAQSSHFPSIVQDCLTKFIGDTKSQLFSVSSGRQLFENESRIGSSRLWDDDENNEILHTRLGEGLISAINKYKDRALITPKAIASYLDRSVTQLCKNVEASRSQQEELNASLNSLKTRCQLLEGENSNVCRLQETLNHSVPKEKFDSLLERYQKCTQEACDAKQLLNEQAYQIQSISSQMDLLADSEKEFEQEVRELKEALAEAQAELCVNKEQLASRESSSEMTYKQNNQLENRLKTSNQELLRLQDNFDSCLSYLSSVIHKVSPHLSGNDRPSAEEFLNLEANLTDNEPDASSSESSILIGCRNVVRTLVAQYGMRLERNLKTAQDQIVEYRSQVAAINREEKGREKNSNSSD